VENGTDPRLAALWQKVDDFFARVVGRYPDDLVCAAGCTSCCSRRLSVTGIEAAAIRGWLAALEAPARAAIIARASASDPASGPCAALDENGHCGIYPVRPLVCRSHGVPLRLPPAPRSLPMLSVCHLNFTARPLESVDADCVLDQATLSTLLYAIDAAHAAGRGGGVAAGQRVDLAEVLSG
jgi:hypothetical protein